MAGSGAGGYNYDFVSELPDRLNCSICLFALRNPVQFMGCGHRFCKLCVDPILSSPQARCPIDRTVASKDKVFEDVACHREVLELHVECPIDNCLWTGRLADVENHVHSSCTKYPLPCVNNCGKVDIARDQMEAHVLTECPLGFVACKYADVGCTAKIRRNDLMHHIQGNIQKHLDLSYAAVNEVRNQVVNITHGLTSTIFFWRIPKMSWHLLKEKGKCVSSKPFHTSPPGYKFRVNFYPNGDRLYEGNAYTSVFIESSRGQYDTILSWPFQRKVTFTLIDQQEDEDKRENVVFSGVPQEECLPRPTALSKMEWGFRNFVSHEKLKEKCFTVNNTIFLQVEVEKKASRKRQLNDLSK